MRLVHAAKPMFARHETFHPRYGWFRKAFQYTADDPKIFSREDAPVQIGVGKNMVRSIRFWGLAAKLIRENAQSSSYRVSEFNTTSIGQALFSDGGWDPFMEDPGSLWLLHWLILAPRSRLPVWWLAFNEFSAVEFTEDDLESVITMKLETTADWINPHPSSVRKDISTLLRTYATTPRSKNIGIDDFLNCPFRELNLIRYSKENNKYRFSFGIQPTLPPEILIYAILDFVGCIDTKSNTVTLSRLAQEPGAPGKIFKLTESEIVAFLEPVIENVDSLKFIFVTGAKLLSWSQTPTQIANQILNQYYGSSNYISSDS